MFEFFEHTADLGLRIRAPDLDTLFIEAVRALFSAIVEDLGAIEPRRRVEIELRADANDYLLFDWLNELLFRFDTEQMIFGAFEAHICAGELKGAAMGEPQDRTRHVLSHEVKAITYHGLKVEQVTEGWLAEVIVDI